jgi:hypothetical protein
LIPRHDADARTSPRKSPMHRNCTAVATLFFLIPTLAAVGAPRGPNLNDQFAGPWDVTWPQSIRRNQDGSVEVLRTRVSRLMLAVEGEAVSGTWEGIRGEVAVTGTLIPPNRIQFATAEPVDDEDRVVIEFRGALEEEVLRGTMEFQWPGGRADPGREWTGVRPEDFAE